MPTQAYIMGQILARIEHAGVHVSYQQHFLAAQSPAQIFPPLISALVQLGKRDAILDLMEHILAQTAFPRTQTMQEQTDFELGYAHERSAQKKGGVQ